MQAKNRMSVVSCNKPNNVVTVKYITGSPAYPYYSLSGLPHATCRVDRLPKQVRFNSKKRNSPLSPIFPGTKEKTFFLELLRGIQLLIEARFPFFSPHIPFYFFHF
jgi:hypothetical protein